MNSHRVSTTSTAEGYERLTEVPTPALIVDLDAFDRNQTAIEAMIRGTGKRIRPHVKTHRTPGLALRQLGPAAAGVTCATVGEAQTMVEAGVPEVLLANEIVSVKKIERMVSLAQHARVIVAVDSAEPVLLFSDAATRIGVTVDMLVDVEVGLGRCGVRSTTEMIELAHAVADAPHLRFVGLMGYEGRLRKRTDDRDIRAVRAFAALSEAKAKLESVGFEVEIVSAAGTSTLNDALKIPDITEIQAGTYALMDPDLEGLDLPFEYALSMTATVISRSENRVVVDAGRKTIGCEYGLPAPLDEHAQAVSISDEHLIIEWTKTPPLLGEQVRLRPSQVRTTFNLHDRVWLVRDDRIIDCLPVKSRSQSQ